ncbi:aspartate ammonia-lyase [Brevibacterium aurantiacum]|uniref:Aspartate ammonia-lyase n=1 Tax=Brevibacterium aurantiacum TaxID=273384 RepID=A0A2H1KJF6_BREAU|nr:aspartate ammonia-lyase [Brevibacterium aurantiacum]SMX99779.1 aspartate ammonia-lyase [Brevibacterium aurantiacum]
MTDSASVPTRTETDSIGSLEIPAAAYWGVHTARAGENFPIARRPVSVYPDFVRAFACVKQAAARANLEIGALDEQRANLIDAACEEIKGGRLHDQFTVGVIQGGAGTSTNMNANEVITNRALEIGGHAKGDYSFINPNDHTNHSQSTNDTYPTAIKIALAFSLQNLLGELTLLADAFAAKGREFSHIIKVGRTQLQDAVPMTLGQEFTAFATTLHEDVQRLEDAVALLGEVNMGATAIGTAINAPVGYKEAVIKHLRTITGLELVTAGDLVESTSDTGVFITFSGALKRSALKMSKIANDLRLLSSGPQAGFGEINLPARQAGSSIMPGKVNPVIPEAVSQVAYSVAGADVTVSMAVEAGQLQLNAFEPVIAHSLFQSITWLERACQTFRVNCVNGITANEAALEDTVARSVTVITALAPVIGYAPAAQLAKQALATNEPISDLVVVQGLLDRTQLGEILKPERLTGLPADHGVDNAADSAEAVPRDEMTSELPVVPSPE